MLHSDSFIYQKIFVFLRAKKCVKKTVTTVQENCGDIYADAKVINEEREAAQAEFEGQAEDMTEVTEETPAETTEEGEAQ